MAYSVNRVTILGNVGREVELRQTHSGKSVANIVVGTDKRWADKASGETKGRTSWHRVTAWDALADMCAKTMKTGSKVYVDGELLYEEFTGKDGVVRHRAFVKADQVVVMAGGEATGKRRSDPPPEERRSQPAWDEGPDPSGDIPF